MAENVLNVPERALDITANVANTVASRNPKNCFINITRCDKFLQ